jgi:hypothetical protein
MMGFCKAFVKYQEDFTRNIKAFFGKPEFFGELLKKI